MFKAAFISSLLSVAALSRGTHDGTSSENARMQWLIGSEDFNVSIYVYTWNELASDGTTKTIHGETVAMAYDTRPWNLSEFIETGFCV